MKEQEPEGSWPYPADDGLHSSGWQGVSSPPRPMAWSGGGLELKERGREQIMGPAGAGGEMKGEACCCRREWKEGGKSGFLLEVHFLSLLFQSDKSK